MAEKKIYKDDIGTVFIIDLGESLAEAEAPKIYVLKPDGEIAEWAADIFEETKIKHVGVQGDLSAAGLFRMQPYVEKSGWKGRGDTVSFTVHDHFK